MKKIFIFVLMAATMLLQGCATSSNYRNSALFAGGDNASCHYVGQSGNTFTFPLTGECFMSTDVKYVYQHPQTRMLELDREACNAAGTIPQVLGGLVGSAIAGYLVQDAAGWQQGLAYGVGSSAGGAASKAVFAPKCRDLNSAVLRYNANQRRAQQPQAQVPPPAFQQPQQPQYGTYEYCVTIANQQGGIQQFTNRCAQYGRNFGFVRTLDGREGCGCQPKT